MRREELLAISFVIMSFNSLYQYSWNVLSPLISEGLHATDVEVGVAFTIFAIVSTVSQLVVSPIVDSRGPRLIGTLASVASAAGFLGGFASRSIEEFYAWWAIGSAGEGILYGIASNVAVKWFPDRRGLATGLVSLGFGFGASVANPFIEAARSFRDVSLGIGLGELVVLTALSSQLRYPGNLKGVSVSKAARTGSWWLLYASFVLALVPLVSFSSFMRGLSGLEGYLFLIAASAFPLASGLGRPVLGAVSDSIGRPLTILASLATSIAASAMAFYGPGLVKIVGVILVGFSGGALIPLFFSVVGDLYGEAYSTSNNAAIYTGKAISGVLGGAVLAVLLSNNASQAHALLLASPAAAAILVAAATGPRIRPPKRR